MRQSPSVGNAGHSGSLNDRDTPLGEYTKVTFVPDTQGDSIIYVPKKGAKTPYEFIDKYEEAYIDLFNEYAR